LRKETEFQQRKYTVTASGSETLGIDVIRFSPKGDLLATGCHVENSKGTAPGTGHGGIIDIFDTRDWRHLAALGAGKGGQWGHSSAVRAFDWSKDGRYIHSVDLSHDLLHWNINLEESSKRDGSGMGDTPWETWSITKGWPVFGMYRHVKGSIKHMDGTSVKAMDVTDPNSVDPNQSLVVAQDGVVALYKYPCTNNQDGGHYFTGHSSHVTNAKFDRTDGMNPGYAVSTGGHDLAAFQWRITR